MKSARFKVSVPVLDDSLEFPNPERANVDGLVAIGGDFSVPRLLQAYRAGIFPWTVNPLTWWSPDPRGIFELTEFHVPGSLQRVLRKGLFQVSIDQAFCEVMKGCAAPGPGRRTTWITPEFLAAYSQLHLEGHAHSLECWQGNQLAGGIYGVAIGGFFAGESMFHRANDASKVALYHLVQHLKARGFVLFDIQMVTPITTRLGGRNIPRRAYLKRLKEAVETDCRF